jgi:hypothetical protein
MSVLLPKEINYTQLPVSLPQGCSTYDVSLRPVNGTSWSCQQAGNQVYWDLPSRAGYMDGRTLSLSYKYTCTSTGVTRIRATPFYSPIQRLEVFFGSQTASNVPNYNVTMNDLVQMKYSVADKIAGLHGFGYGLEQVTPSTTNLSQITASAMTLSGCDGRVLQANEVGTFYGPLPCILTAADKFLPLGMMNQVRVQITLDSISTIFSSAAVAQNDGFSQSTPLQSATTGAVPSDFVISDLVLQYTHIDMGPEVDASVRSMGDKIVIKSESFTSAANTLNIGTSGTVELLYSQKLASIKSLFLHCSSTSANGIFDSFEVLGGSGVSGTTGGDLQFNIASKLYPSTRPLSPAIQNRSTLQLELKKAIGSLYDTKSGMSISPQEYIAIGTESTVQNPAKVIYGVCTQQLQSNSVLLSGVSTQNSPVTARLNITTPLTKTVSALLISCFDVLIEIDPATRDARVIQ